MVRLISNTEHRNSCDLFVQVCINYRDPDYLREECQDGRELGFTGKV